MINNPEHLPPHSLEAEQAVLGSILIDPDLLFEVNTFLKPSDFFIVKHGWIYGKMLELSEARIEIDNLTLIEAMRPVTIVEGNLLDAIGGSAYLTELINNAQDTAHIETYARIVELASVRRRLLTAAGTIAHMALEENTKVEIILEKSESLLFHLGQRNQGSDSETVGQIASRYFDRVEKLYTHEIDQLGIPTGFSDLDGLLHGLKGGDLIILAAPPSIGKTAFALNVAMNAVRCRNKENHLEFPILFMSLEMAKDQLINRIVGSAINLNTMDLQTGNLNENQWDRFTNGLSELNTLPLFIDDDPDITIQKLRSKARRLKHSQGIQAVFLDYLQMMHEPGYNNREQEITFITRGLKSLAKELNIPVIAVASLSRAVEQRADHRPMLSDLRDSGNIEYSADVVLFLYRDEVYNENTERPNQCDVIVAKHRNGPTGVTTLYFRKEYTQFTNMQKSKIDLREEYGEPNPQRWSAPPPRPAPIHLPDDGDEPEEHDIEGE